MAQKRDQNPCSSLLGQFLHYIGVATGLGKSVLKNQYTIDSCEVIAHVSFPH